LKHDALATVLDEREDAIVGASEAKGWAAVASRQ
jgi:hypothetical protein